MHQIVWPRRILHLAQIGFSLGQIGFSLGQIGFLWARSDFLWARSDFLWSGSIFDLDQKNAIWARSKIWSGSPGPDLVLVGSKSGRATSFFLAQK